MQEWHDELAERYAELRRTHFNTEALQQRVEAYARLFAESGADEREGQRRAQYHSDVKSAAEYMTEWMAKRIETLDNKYGYDPVIDGVNQAVAGNYLQISGGKNQITVRYGKAQHVRVFNLSGRMVRQGDLNEGFNVLNHFEPGIYVIEGRKVVVE